LARLLTLTFRKGKGKEGGGRKRQAQSGETKTTHLLSINAYYWEGGKGGGEGKRGGKSRGLLRVILFFQGEEREGGREGGKRGTKRPNVTPAITFDFGERKREEGEGEKDPFEGSQKPLWIDTAIVGRGEGGRKREGGKEMTYLVT